MSYPILYEVNEVDFNHNGLGILTDAVSCTVTEERNGAFEIEMKYPMDGRLGEALMIDRVLKVDTSHQQKDQLFRIKRIDKNHKGMLEVYGQHVSYLTTDLAMPAKISIPNVVGGTVDAQVAMNQWRDAIIGNHPIQVSSDVRTQASTELTLREYQNARDVLGGVNGSILSNWGGEFLWDNYHIRLLTNRGGRVNTLISYGRNCVTRFLISA